MNCQNCGHPKESHIYLEGACRPGFICPCDHYVPEVVMANIKDTMRNIGPGMITETPEIIPLKSMDPDVSEILERLIQETGLHILEVEDRGTFEADYGLLRDSILELKRDLEWATSSNGANLIDDEKRETIRKKWGLPQD